MNIELSAPVSTAVEATEAPAQFMGTDGASRGARRAAALAAIQGDAPSSPASEPDDAGDSDAPAPRERPAMLPSQPAASDDEPAEETRLSTAVRAREKASRIRREAEAERAAVARDRASLDAERREIAQLRAARETLAKDPLAGLKELGLDMRDLVERAAIDGTPDAQIRELQRRLEAQERAAESDRAGRANQDMQTRRTTAEAEFKAIASSDESYPFLAARSELYPDLVKQQAYQLQDDYYKQTGKVPTLNEIAEALDYLAGEEYRHVHERQARRGTNTSRDTGTAPAAVKAKPSRTLAAAKAGEKSTATATTANMSRDERKAFALNMLRSGRL